MALSGNVIDEAAGTINGTPTVFVEQAYAIISATRCGSASPAASGLDYNKEAFVTFAYDKINGPNG